MHICRISRTFPPNVDGTAYHVLGLSQTLSQDPQIEQTLIQPYPQGESYRGPRLDILTVAAPSPQIYLSQRAIFTFNMRAARRALQAHRQHPVDLIHGHGDLVDGLVQGILAWRLKVPYILTVHGAVNRKWKYPLLMRLARPFMTRMIGVAEITAQGLAQAGYPSDRITVASSGVFVDRFYRLDGEQRSVVRQRWGLDPQGTLFLSVGRLHPMKGYTGLIPAYLKAPSLAHTQLAIAGDGPERPLLEPLAAEANGRVRLLGNCSHEEVMELLAVADAFVLSSVRLRGTGEGTPTAVIEAMAAGLPIVATLTGGIPQLGLDPATLVPEEDWDSLIRAMGHAATEEPWRSRTGAENRQLAQDRDWPHIAERVNAVYQAALDARERRSGQPEKRGSSDDNSRVKP